MNGSGKLSNSGERVSLRDAQGHVVDQLEYGVGFPWPIADNGEGASLELLNMAADNA